MRAWTTTPAAGTDTGGIQNRLGVLFFCLLYLALMTLSSLPVWRQERLLYLRERDTGAYKTPAYFAAVRAGAPLSAHAALQDAMSRRAAAASGGRLLVLMLTTLASAQ